MQFSRGISDYFGLKRVNIELARENAQLKKQVSQLNQNFYNLEVRENKDFDIINQYHYISAKVIKNSVRQLENYITINKGKADGIEPGMAVTDHLGVVGKVKTVSTHFALITSILHKDVLVSAKIRRTGDLCTVRWDGLNPYEARVWYVSRHISLEKGDTIVTSGYNAVFPQDLPVGIIKNYELTDDSPFYDIKIELANDLNSLSHVYLIKNNLKVELDSIQVSTE